MRRRTSGTWLAGVACALVLSGASPARAQAQAPPGPPPSPQPSVVAPLERQFLRNLLRDQKAIWTSPVHVRASDVRWLAPLFGGTAVLIATDRETGDAIAEHPGLVEPSDAISYAGSAGALTAASVAFYLIGRATHNDRARETGILGGQALIDSILVIAVTKTATQRARPDAGEDRGRFFVGGRSFPSGHAAESWALATVIAHEYRGKPAVQIAAYSFATIVSLSRFTAQRHYLSDILVGSAIGYGIGRYVYRAHHIVNRDGRPSRWPLIAPQYDRHAGAYGITVTWLH